MPINGLLKKSYLGINYTLSVLKMFHVLSYLNNFVGLSMAETSSYEDAARCEV